MSSTTMPQNTRGLAFFPFILVFFEIANYLANDMYLPALPNIAKDFNITAHAAQMTLTTWFLGTASLTLVLGPISDWLGRRPILLGGGVLFVVASIVCALATNIHILLIARFFQGSSACSIGAAGYSSIHECFDQKKAIHILAIMGSITVLAPAFGPLLGAVFLHWFSWRWIFGMLAIWALVALIILWFWMPESLPKEQRQALHWQRILRNYSAILSNPKFVFNTLTFCLTFLGMIAWIAAGPFLVIDEYKFSTIFFGIFQAMVFGCLIVGAQLVKPIMTRIGVEHLIDLGLLIALLGGIIAVILTLVLPHNLLGLVVALMIFTFGSSLAFSPANRLAIEACTEPMGARSAMFSTLMSIAGVTGGLLVSTTYTGTIQWLAYLLFIVASLVCLTRWVAKLVFHI